MKESKTAMFFLFKEQAKEIENRFFLAARCFAQVISINFLEYYFPVQNYI